MAVDPTRHDPAIWLCSCVWPHLLWPSVSNISWDVVWTLVFFCMDMLVAGCVRPSIHWSNLAARDDRTNSRISPWFQSSAVQGLSIWAWRPASIWRWHISWHSLRWTLASSWFVRTFAKLWRLHCELKRFHALHGPHTGESHACRGRYKMIQGSNVDCPSLVLRSPSCKVNLLALSPHLLAVAVSLLLGYA